MILYYVKSEVDCHFGEMLNKEELPYMRLKKCEFFNLVKKSNSSQKSCGENVARKYIAFLIIEKSRF